MPLAGWGGNAGQNEFWVCIDVRKAVREWPWGRPLVGWFREGCYLFSAAQSLICAGMSSRIYLLFSLAVLASLACLAILY